MKFMLFLLTFYTLPVVHAAPYLSTRIFSTAPQTLDVPQDLSFKAPKIKIAHGGWYSSLFETNGCERSLSGKDLEIPIELRASGPHEIELILDHHASKRVHYARASFVPQYFKNSVPIREHYIVKLKDWVMLHLSIRADEGRKVLRLGVVQGRGDDVHLQPVFEAQEE